MSQSSLPSQPSLQTMNIFNMDHKLKGVEQKVELVEPVEIVPLDLAEP